MKSNSIVRSMRLMRIVAKSTFNKRTLALFSTAVAGVYCVGAYEAQLLLSPAFKAHVSAREVMQFAHHYASEQMFTSCIWTTKPADIIALSIGLDPCEVLRPLILNGADQTALAAGSSEPANLAGTSNGIKGHNTGMAAKKSMVGDAMRLGAQSAISDAEATLRAQGCAAIRSVMASAVALTQVLRTLAAALSAGGQFRNQISGGREPIFPNDVQQRVIRLCGRESDVTALSLRRYGRHILPILERQYSKWGGDHDYMANAPPVKGGSAAFQLIRQHSDGLRVPVYWHVPENEYSNPWSWEGFDIGPSFLLSTTTGRHILYMEADATNSEQSLALGRPSRDLTLECASQAFRNIEGRVRASLGNVDDVDLRGFRTMRVFLGDLTQKIRSGGGSDGKRKLRRRAEERREMDVLIDSQAIVLHEIVKWGRKMGVASRKKTKKVKEQQKIANRVDDETDVILFDTTSRDYFQDLSMIMERFGFDIACPYDVVQPRDEESLSTPKTRKELRRKDICNDEASEDPRGVCNSSMYRDGHVQSAGDSFGAGKGGGETAFNGGSDEENFELPRLIYCTTTAESVNAAQSLVAAGAVNPAKCCVLLDDAWGVKAVQNLVSETGHRFHAICSAVLYDDILRQCRVWARLGHSAEEIQEELDAKFAHIHQSVESVQTGKDSGASSS
jgi:hypothetical protein